MFPFLLLCLAIFRGSTHCATERQPTRKGLHVKKLLSLLAVCLLVCFCVSAQAAVKEYAMFSIDVPDDWTETKYGDQGAEFLAPDKSCKIGVAFFPKSDQSLDDMAKAIADQYKAKAEKDSDGAYSFEYKDDGKDAFGYLAEEGDHILALTIAGEHAQAEAILDSVTPK